MHHRTRLTGDCDRADGATRPARFSFPGPPRTSLALRDESHTGVPARTDPHGAGSRLRASLLTREHERHRDGRFAAGRGELPSADSAGDTARKTRVPSWIRARRNVLHRAVRRDVERDVHARRHRRVLRARVERWLPAAPLHASGVSRDRRLNLRRRELTAPRRPRRSPAIDTRTRVRAQPRSEGAQPSRELAFGRRRGRRRRAIGNLGSPGRHARFDPHALAGGVRFLGFDRLGRRCRKIRQGRLRCRRGDTRRSRWCRRFAAEKEPAQREPHDQRATTHGNPGENGRPASLHSPRKIRPEPRGGDAFRQQRTRSSRDCPGRRDRRGRRCRSGH